MTQLSRTKLATALEKRGRFSVTVGTLKIAITKKPGGYHITSPGGSWFYRGSTDHQRSIALDRFEEQVDYHRRTV